jgi:hypothetical protein
MSGLMGATPVCDPGRDDTPWAAPVGRLDLGLTQICAAPEAVTANPALVRREFGRLLQAESDTGRTGFLRWREAMPRLFGAEALPCPSTAR